MISLVINPGLKRALPDLALGYVTGSVEVEKLNAALWETINRHLERLVPLLKADEVSALPQIAAMRAAYKTLGKDPSRYRGSAEALLRRVLAGKGLYQINNVVDINNLVSLESFLPLGSYDLDRVSGPAELRIGSQGEKYKGIGKDEVNVENLPVFADSHGAFGSPTSDSERAMVRPETRRVLMVVFSFAGTDGLAAWTARARQLLVDYARGGECEGAILG